MFSIIHLGGDLEHHPGLHLETTSLSPSSGGGSHQPGNISNPPPPVLLHEAAEHKCKLALFLSIQLLTWRLSQLVYCTAAAFQFLQTWAFSWVASQAPSIIMIVGQLLDFILLQLDVSIMASLPECDSFDILFIDVCTIHHMRVGQLLDFILLHILASFSIIHLGGSCLQLGTTSLSTSSGEGSHQPGNISTSPQPVRLQWRWRLFDYLTWLLN